VKLPLILRKKKSYPIMFVTRLCGYWVGRGRGRKEGEASVAALEQKAVLVYDVWVVFLR